MALMPAPAPPSAPRPWWQWLLGSCGILAMLTICGILTLGLLGGGAYALTRPADQPPAAPAPANPDAPALVPTAAPYVQQPPAAQPAGNNPADTNVEPPANANPAPAGAVEVNGSCGVDGTYLETGIGKILVYNASVPDGWIAFVDSWTLSGPGVAWTEGNGFLEIQGPWQGTLTIGEGAYCAVPSTMRDYYYAQRSAQVASAAVSYTLP